jgi:hypothetical protein
VGHRSERERHDGGGEREGQRRVKGRGGGTGWTMDLVGVARTEREMGVGWGEMKPNACF